LPALAVKDNQDNHEKENKTVKTSPKARTKYVRKGTRKYAVDADYFDKVAEAHPEYPWLRDSQKNCKEASAVNVSDAIYNALMTSGQLNKLLYRMLDDSLKVAKLTNELSPRQLLITPEKNER